LPVLGIWTRLTLLSLSERQLIELARGGSPGRTALMHNRNGGAKASRCELADRASGNWVRVQARSRESSAPPRPSKMVLVSLHECNSTVVTPGRRIGTVVQRVAEFFVLGGGYGSDCCGDCGPGEDGSVARIG
jgi:hypothetical protein